MTRENNIRPERPLNEKNSKNQSPTDQLKELFVDVVQENKIKLGQHPAKRPVFLKPHGIAHGMFEIVDNIPEDLKIGVFALKNLAAWVRFSSDTTPDRKDLQTTCGVAIKIFGVKGPKLLGDGDTQDFILQNHDVFFVDTAQDMAEFTAAGVIDKDYGPYLSSHPKTRQILNEMTKVEASSLTATYWGVLPYAFGNNRYVKYKLEPEEKNSGLPFEDNDYLAKDLKRRLMSRPAKFKFMLQFQTNPQIMPLDQATVRWDEKISPPIHVANLILPQQDITEIGQAEYGENLSFNPWHCLKEHEPQGSIALARKVVYAASARKRHDVNGVPNNEPKEPRIINSSTTSTQEDTTIVRAAIYPSIGIGRVGNSLKDFFIGPEILDPQPVDPGCYRDKEGALKRQAARFRIYGLNAKGEAIKELTIENAKIKWGVHLANKKSSWYQFQLALDIPEVNSAPPSLLRNITVSDRSQLIIDPGYKTISGKNTTALELNGKFMDIAVCLGEISTDELGRLIVLGGRGKSASYTGINAVTFANNEGWHDDISDGPITAQVELEGINLPVDPAWVVIAPPNYAPQQKSIRTMWDLIRDVAVTDGTLAKPVRPSFQQDIKPIFERLSNLQWVNAGFAGAFGWHGPFNFISEEWMQKLSDPTPINKKIRSTLMRQFRDSARDGDSPVPWPWVYGDAMNYPSSTSPRQNSSLSDLQLGMLQQWADGDFINDYEPHPKQIKSLEELPINMQPDILTKAALENCLADAFHPGCEMTWPMRSKELYMAPFRIKHATADTAEANYGPTIDDSVLQLPDGPIMGGQRPGGITRWMAVPWQTDTASCRSGYGKTYGPYLPTFWPARVPNQVLSKQNYDMVTNENLPLDQRLQAFANRMDWVSLLMGESYTEQINYMIQHFDKMPLVELRSSLTADANFPRTMGVAEDLTEYSDLQDVASNIRNVATQNMDSSERRKTRDDPLELELIRIEKVRRMQRRNN